MSSSKYPKTRAELGVPRFKRGDIVIESLCNPLQSIPMKVERVVRPTASKGDIYYSGYEYVLRAVFLEDEGFFLNGKQFFEEGLAPFSQGKDEMIGALYSRIQELEELVR